MANSARRRPSTVGGVRRCESCLRGSGDLRLVMPVRSVDCLLTSNLPERDALRACEGVRLLGAAGVGRSFTRGDQIPREVEHGERGGLRREIQGNAEELRHEARSAERIEIRRAGEVARDERSRKQPTVYGVRTGETLTDEERDEKTSAVRLELVRDLIACDRGDRDAGRRQEREWRYDDPDARAGDRDLATECADDRACRD